MSEQNQNTEQNNINLEQVEIDALLDRGVELQVGKETFTIYRPFGGQLDLLAECLLNMEHDTEEFDQNSDLEAQKLVKKTIRWMARAIAIMILGQKCARIIKIPFLNTVLSARVNEKRINKMTDFILWNMTTKDVVMFSQNLVQLTGIVDFIFSIRLTLKMTRTTKPNLIEKNQSKPA
ncbi:MAG: hypothetical protein BGO31_14195 [Bacteroidetes bacterium 43-16]|nr:MAG: hypothetical protein BGO31_14195 [Bacteroidetes bacterium 43-16]